MSAYYFIHLAGGFFGCDLTDFQNLVLYGELVTELDFNYISYFDGVRSSCRLAVYHNSFIVTGFICNGPSFNNSRNL